MPQIHEPVLECLIIVTEFVVSDNEHGPLTFFNRFEFKSMQELREYLLSRHNVALSLGYDFKVADQSAYNYRVIGRLGFQYKDRYTTPKLEFKSVPDFVLFLKEHPPLAALVGYRPK